MAAITWGLGNQHPNAPEMVKRFWHYLYIRGRWRLCETCTREALEQATIQEDTPGRLWLASHLGWLFEEQGRVSEALKQLHEVEAEILALERPALLAETGVLNYLGQVYRRQGDLQRAETCLTRALAVAEQIGDRRSTLRVHYHLAWVQVERGRMAEAEQWYRDLLMEARAIGWQRAEGYCAKRLARALVELSRLEEAEQWLNLAGAMADHWQEPLLQADILFGRARLERQRAQLGEVPGAIQKARRLAEDARDLYQRLEAHWDISEVQQFLAGLDGSSPD